MRRDILEETFRLLARHFDLFTMIALTVWLPGHLVINYLDFFATSKGAADAAARSFRVAILLEGVFGPLVVAATLAALLTIKQGQPPRYLAAMRWAIILWPRLFLARLVVSVAVLAGLVALVVPGAILLVRLAFVDALVALDGVPLGQALRISNTLTAGRRRGIFWTGGFLFAAVFSSNRSEAGWSLTHQDRISAATAVSTPGTGSRQAAQSSRKGARLCQSGRCSACHS